MGGGGLKAKVGSEFTRQILIQPRTGFCPEGCSQFHVMLHKQSSAFPLKLLDLGRDRRKRLSCLRGRLGPRAKHRDDGGGLRVLRLKIGFHLPRDDQFLVGKAQGCFHKESSSHAALRTAGVSSAASCRSFLKAYSREKFSAPDLEIACTICWSLQS